MRGWKLLGRAAGDETPRIDSQPIDCDTQLIEGGPVSPIDLPRRLRDQA